LRADGLEAELGDYCARRRLLPSAWRTLARLIISFSKCLLGFGLAQALATFWTGLCKSRPCKQRQGNQKRHYERRFHSFLNLHLFISYLYIIFFGRKFHFSIQFLSLWIFVAMGIWQTYTWLLRDKYRIASRIARTWKSLILLWKMEFERRAPPPNYSNCLTVIYLVFPHRIAASGLKVSPFSSREDFLKHPSFCLCLNQGQLPDEAIASFNDNPFDSAPPDARRLALASFEPLMYTARPGKLETKGNSPTKQKYFV
jgi:hypothetical protein